MATGYQPGRRDQNTVGVSSVEKAEYIFVIEDKIGGIAYLNKNLIDNTSLREGVTVKVILLDQLDSDHPRFPDTFRADEIVRFKYGTYENKHAVLKRLSKLFGTAPGAIICNDGLEMLAIYEHGTNKTVYHIIHDFYNVKLSIKFEGILDVYLAHTRLFSDALLSADPASVQSYFLPHGVMIPKPFQIRPSAGNLKIVFTGRLVEGKGVQHLYAINQLLLQKGITVSWTIIGKGQLKSFLEDQWKDKKNVQFASPDTNEEVRSLVSQHDLFVLPTRFEGSPVTVLEALSVGVVPVISDLPGGIREIVNEEIGRRVPVGNIELFADAIAALDQDRDLLQQLKSNARKLAEEQFDILKTSDNYFRVIGQFSKLKKKMHTDLPVLKFGFALDKKWLPNAMVSFLRKKKFT